MESWRPVPEDDRYEVSDLGNVRSYAVRGDAGARSAEPTMLKRTINRDGYRVVTFGRGNQRKLHRVVLEAFVGPCPPGMMGCHNNGDPGDCRLSNLRWDTGVGNAADEVLHGTHNRGERNNTTKLTETQVLAIRASTEPVASLAARYGVCEVTVRQIRRRATWRHLIDDETDTLTAPALS